MGFVQNIKPPTPEIDKHQNIYDGKMYLYVLWFNAFIFFLRKHYCGDYFETNHKIVICGQTYQIDYVSTLIPNT